MSKLLQAETLLNELEAAVEAGSADRLAAAVEAIRELRRERIVIAIDRRDASIEGNGVRLHPRRHWEDQRH